MAQTKKRRPFDIFFVLILFCTFAVVSLSLVSLGGRLYHTTVQQMDDSAEVRACLSYVANKVRAAGTQGVSLSEVEGVPALCLTESSGQAAYDTYIYHQNGALYELFLPHGQAPALSLGSELYPVNGFSFRQNGRLLTLTCTPAHGAAMTLELALPDQGGV